MVTGDESLTDGTLAVAQLAARQRVPVHLLRYEYMPHLWYTFLKGLPQARHCVESCAAACTAMARGRLAGSRAALVRLGDLRSKPLDVMRLMPIDHRRVVDLMAAARQRRVSSGYVWAGPTKPTGPRRSRGATL